MHVETQTVCLVPRYESADHSTQLQSSRSLLGFCFMCFYDPSFDAVRVSRSHLRSDGSNGHEVHKVSDVNTVDKVNAVTQVN